MSFYVRRCAGEDYLWTVGFDHPRDGWQPESDHDSERDAKRWARELNGVKGRYVYLRSEPGLWAVGTCENGFWDPVSDHDSAAGAAETVMEMNA